MSEVGYIVFEVGYIVFEVGYIVFEVGYILYDEGYILYDAGYIVFEVGYIVFEVGYIVFAGYVLQRSNSSQTSQRDGQTQPTTRPASEDKFDYEPTSFPPLPGSEVITITGFFLI